MTRNKLILALIAAGLVLAASSAAFNLNPTRWFAKDDTVIAQTGVTPAPASPPVPLALSLGTTPNYRAIVQQMGPASSSAAMA